MKIIKKYESEKEGQLEFLNDYLNDEILKEINENNYEVELRNIEKVKSINEK